MGLVVKLVILGIVLAFGAITARKMARAAKEPIFDDQCVSCGSGNVQVQGPGAYVCMACGYEGGSGRAAMNQQKQAERYVELAPDARLGLVTDHVRTALRILADVKPHGAVDVAAGVASELDLLSGAEGYDASVAGVASALSQAATELRTAQAIAGGPIVLANGMAVDAHGVERSLLGAQDSPNAMAAMKMTAQNASGYLQSVLVGTEPQPLA